MRTNNLHFQDRLLKLTEENEDWKGTHFIYKKSRWCFCLTGCEPPTKASFGPHLQMATGSQLLSVDFEVFGHVQGVCFRMYTEQEAARVGVVGWVKNTRGGTVVGHLQGRADDVQHMKAWLSETGSPSSRITKTSFSNERTLPALEMSGFSTRY
ncbi:acylphosphatase 2, muscle type isoform X2 [Vanacampus margaritifer]